MRRALEEDKYSAVGSIVDTDTSDDEAQYRSKTGNARLDRQAIVSAMRKRVWMDRMNGKSEEGDFSETTRVSRKKKRKKGVRRKADDLAVVEDDNGRTDEPPPVVDEPRSDEIAERDEGSIFGQTTGSSNATWVECDKCKKVSFFLSDEQNSVGDDFCLESDWLFSCAGVFLVPCLCCQLTVRNMQHIPSCRPMLCCAVPCRAVPP